MNDQGIVHIALGFIFAAAIVAVDAIIGYFSGGLSSTDILFLVSGNVGIAAFNGYYIGNVILSPTGVQATSQSTPPTL